MRVLAVIPQYPPRSRVGAWITTHEYLAALAARGHQVDVVALGLNSAPYTIDGVNVWPRDSEVDAPDVVVSHLGDMHQGARIAQKVGCPSVRMVHGYHDDNATKLGQAGGTDLAVFSSHALAAATGWDGPQLVAHPPVRQADYETSPGDMVTLTNLSVEKGGELLKFIAASMFDVKFLGVMGHHGRQLRAGQPGNVEVIKSVEDMRTVYTRTRILLMPSERETYGRVGVEAACSGIPTIAHPSPGLQEALGDSATWVDRSDLNAWCEAIRRLQDPGAWLEASRRSRRAIQADPEGTITNVADAVESIVKVAV